MQPKHWILALVSTAVCTLMSLPLGAQTIRVCISTFDCPNPFFFTDLQEAFDFASEFENRQSIAQIRLDAGWHTNDRELSPETLTVTNWRANCAPKTAQAAFVLRNRENFTLIEGATDDPADTRVWTKVPRSFLKVLGRVQDLPIFHGLALVDNKASVEIHNLSLVSDGGISLNGAADATLYVGPIDPLYDATVRLENVVVTGNKTQSNCLRDFNGSGGGPLFYHNGEPVYHDQHGANVDGGNLNPFTSNNSILEAYDSVIGGNIHTGALLLDGATISGHHALVQGNGWDGDIWQQERHGYGVTTFWDEDEATCLEGTNHVTLLESNILNNSGHGVYLRGAFDQAYPRVEYNDIQGNSRCGVGSDGGYPDLWSTYSRSEVSLAQNSWGEDQDNVCLDRLVLSSTRFILDTDTDVTLGNIVADWYSGITLVAPDQPGSGWDGTNPYGIDLWDSLQAVNTALAYQPRICG